MSELAHARRRTRVVCQLQLWAVANEMDLVPAAGPLSVEFDRRWPSRAVAEQVELHYKPMKVLSRLTFPKQSELLGEENVTE